MICAACGETTETSPCSHCGAEPLLDGRYRLEAVCGQGASGTTWRARPVENEDELVAVKEMPLRFLALKQRQLLGREVGLLAQLSHPRLPRYIEDFERGSGKQRTHYLVTGFIAGRTLAEEMERHRYDAEEVRALLAELLSILSYLHTLSPPVVHRDIKPANIIRGPDGQLHLIDFGSVQDALRGPHSARTVAGTFGFMAPEQLVGDASPASDLYAAGVVAIHLLTRVDPTELSGVDRVLRWRHRATVSEPFGELLDELVQAEPARRPRRAALVQDRLNALKGIAAGTRAPAPSDGPRAEQPSLPLVPRRRNALPAKVRGPWLAAGMGLLLPGVPQLILGARRPGSLMLASFLLILGLAPTVPSLTALGWLLLGLGAGWDARRRVLRARRGG